MRYFFVLGRNPALSIAEILSLVPKGTITGYSNEIVTLSQEGSDPPFLRLGGTIKAGIVQEGVYAQKDLEAVCESLLYTQEPEFRTHVGFSVYAGEDGAVTMTPEAVHAMSMSLKRRITGKGERLRVVTSRERTLSSVVVAKNHLLDRGVEIVFIGTKQGFLIGCTTWVQAFEDQSNRDFGRPARGMEVGMLPVQLARIMINLSGVAPNETLLDPFCGFGTVLTEAIAMGHHRVIGADKEVKMVDATEKNLSWLTGSTDKSYEIREVQFITSPVEQLSRHVRPRSVEGIVTEPYLGPTRGMMDYESVIKELAQLYSAAFEQFSIVLKPGGRVVFIFPAFKTGHALKKTSEHVLSEIKKMGFRAVPLLPEAMAKSYNLKNRTSIVYARSDQKIVREILVFEKK